MNRNTFKVLLIYPNMLEATFLKTFVFMALVVSLDKPFPWAVGFFFRDTELRLELWNVIAGLLGFDD